MGPLVICLLVHHVAVQLVPSPWICPDFTTLGLVLTIARRPSSWWLASIVTGLWLMVWAIRFPVWVALASFGCGAFIRAAAGPWDLADSRVQGLVVSAASAGLTVTGLWLDAHLSPLLLGMAALRVALTVLSLPLAQAIQRLPSHVRSAKLLRPRA